MSKRKQPNVCAHPPTRLYAWYADDGTLCVGCCECGEVLRGGVDPDEEREQEAVAHETPIE